MATFSFDIVAEYDKAEMNNVFALVEREMANRYDFKGTPASIEWMNDKKGFKIIGDSQWQLEAITDIIRKKLASRNISSKVLDLSEKVQESNMKASQEIPFKSGLPQDMAKRIVKDIRDNFPKVKPQIQGEAIRVTSSSKDDLQKVISFTSEADYDRPLQYINYR